MINMWAWTNDKRDLGNLEASPLLLRGGGPCLPWGCPCFCGFVGFARFILEDVPQNGSVDIHISLGHYLLQEVCWETGSLHIWWLETTPSHLVGYMCPYNQRVNNTKWNYLCCFINPLEGYIETSTWTAGFNTPSRNSHNLLRIVSELL